MFLNSNIIFYIIIRVSIFVYIFYIVAILIEDFHYNIFYKNIFLIFYFYSIQFLLLKIKINKVKS